METEDIDFQNSMSPGRCLGTGPFGHVFAIDDDNILKFILEMEETEYHTEEARERLQLERTIYERLGKHDRICEFRYAFEGGHVVERLKINLSGRLFMFASVGKPPPLKQTLKWSIQAAEACAYIHGKGVIKSNLSTRNLFMDKNENIKLHDFTSSSIDGSVPRERSDKGFGRPGTDATKPDIQDNLFALGGIMYQISTGNEPSWNSTHSAAHHFRELSRVAIASVITKCWLGQYHSAAEVVKELREIYAKEIGSPMPTERSYVTGTGTPPTG
ncbi:hypothetical protein H2204_006158 [Knufia peltigerae]|uniref:Protein kinase domain-containing protein n=1 Tax=Knufia peltigerae TaxID=1002370 RepID=A0AA38Y472_9EURO|nr:hypothetical protein H2204_006158 [Knufia peltigerae]